MVALNERLARASATYERMMEHARYSKPGYGYHTAGPAPGFYNPAQPGQSAPSGMNFSAVPPQQQYGSGPIQGQPAPFQQDPRYAPYTPQLSHQQPLQQPQPSSQPQFQQQQPIAFDQAYANQGVPQPQQPMDYGVPGAQQLQQSSVPFSPQQPQHQQPIQQQPHQQQLQQQQPIQQQPIQQLPIQQLPQAQPYQGYQQPVAATDFAQQQQQQPQQPQQPTFVPQQASQPDNQTMYAPQPPANFAPPTSGYAPQQQFVGAPPFQ